MLFFLMILLNVFICITFFVTQRAFSQNETITTHVSAKEFLYTKDSSERSVKFRVYPSSSANETTILFLCGGPGRACSLFRPPNIPADYEVITVDYLGVGDNSHFNSDSEMQIESQGKMIASLIRFLKRNKLFLYATSYGTAVATVTGSILDQENFVAGIVLEGTVGPGRIDYEMGYKNVGDKVWSQLSNTERDDFKNGYLELSQQLTAIEKTALDVKLTFDLQQDKSASVRNLKYFKSNLPYAKPALLDFWQSFSRLLSGNGLAHLRSNACQIFDYESSSKTTLGGLVTINTGAPKDLCIGQRSPLWNPEDYPIRNIPLLYLNGTTDPATPLEWAHKHFEIQRENLSKIFLEVEDAGHAVLMADRWAMCTEFIFENLSLKSFSKIKENAKFIQQGCKK